MSKKLYEVLMFIQELLNISETEKHFINLSNYETRLNLIKTKQALIRLEAIDNANPSEALESLELAMKVLTKIFGKEVLNEHNINFDTIKQALIQANQYLGARRNGRTLEQMYQLVQYSKTPMKPSIWIARIDGKLEQRVVMEKDDYDKLQIKAQEQEQEKENARYKNVLNALENYLHIIPICDGTDVIRLGCPDSEEVIEPNDFGYDIIKEWLMGVKNE